MADIPVVPEGEGNSTTQKFVYDVVAKFNQSEFGKIHAAINQQTQAYAALSKQVKGASESVVDLGAKSVFKGLATLDFLKKLGFAFKEVTIEQARMYEQLFYMNQRVNGNNLGLGIAGLSGFGFAMKQIGLTAQAGYATIESYGAAMRMQPGLAGLLRKLAPKAFGKSGEPQEDIIELVSSLKKGGEKGYLVGALLSQNFGIDERTFRNLWENIDTINDEYKAHTQRLKELGLNTDKASENFVKFSRSLNTIIDIIEIQATQIASKFVEHIGTPVANRVAKTLMMPKDPVARSALGGAAELLLRNALPGSGIFLNTPNPNPSGLPFKGTVNPLTPSGTSNNLKESAISYYQNLGISRNAALGIVTGMQGESGANLDPNSTNPTSKMFGIMNWDTNRRNNFKRIFGHDIHGSTREEQMQFAAMEMQGTGGDPGTAKAFAQLKANPNISAGAATTIFESLAERHGDAAYTAKLARQADQYSATHGGQNFDFTHGGVNITVNGPVDYGTLNSMNSMLSIDKHSTEQQWRQMVRSATVR